MSSSVASVSTCATVTSKDLTTDITNQIDTRIAGVTADNTSKSLFTTRGDGTSGWIRSSTVWTARGVSLDFTGASPWNSDLQYKKAGTLISPRHIVFANHYAITNGTKIIFVDKNNAIVTRTLVDQKQIGTTDIRVGVLDSDVPSSITFYPMIAYNDLMRYLPAKQFGSLSKFLPIVALDQEDHAIIRDVYSLDPTSVLHNPSMLSTARRAFSEDIITGDSGNPGFVVVNGKLVLVLTHYGTNGGYYQGSYITEINQAMTALGGTYQVTKFDLSCFTPLS